MQTKLAHVCIESSDLAATEAFYRVLGLERRFIFNNLQGELVGFYLAFGNNTFIEVIKISKTGTGKPKPPGIIRHFAIEVDDIDATYAQLKKHHIDVTEKELAKDHQWMVTCTDPNGIFVELQQYTPQSMQLVGGICEVDYRP
jgi:catechol 2,3-dioxygenase-like lactoylglutathione lyase family enzyme